jgi:hypothetical protein
VITCNIGESGIGNGRLQRTEVDGVQGRDFATEGLHDEGCHCVSDMAGLVSSLVVTGVCNIGHCRMRVIGVAYP